MNRPRSAVLALGILIVCAPCAFALNPSLDVNQYAHTSWKINEGFSKGVIWSIAQTPDGYLWLGAEFGLLRFDGVRAVPWEPPAGERLPSSDIRSLRAARDGRLWIGTLSGLVSWKDGKISRYPELDGQIIEALLEDREHTMWVIAGWALSKARLCRIQNDKTECYENSGVGVTTIYEDSNGNLWAGAMNGVWRWTPGPPKLYPMPGPAQRTYALIESEDGGILIARRDGISKLTNGRFETYAPTSGLDFPPDRLLRDRDGGLWVGALTDHGLLHIHHGKTDLFTRTDGLSGNTVTCVFEDREGNVWVSTTDGLDHFRDFAIPPISQEQGFSIRSVSALVAAKDGSLWLGTSDGLTLWNKEEITIYRGRRPRTRNSPLRGTATNPSQHSAVTLREIFDSGMPSNTVTSLFEDQEKLWVGTLGGVGVVKSDRFSAVPSLPPGNIFSITGDRAGNVWISDDDALFHLHHERLVERIPWANFGHNEPARALLHDAVQGGLWIGFRDGGVAFFKDGQVRASFTSAQGLGEGRIHGFYSDAGGAIWVATQGGLSRIEEGRVLTLTTQNGLGCNTVNWMIEDDAGSVWLYMACGLVRIARSELDAWVSQAKQTVETTVFDSFDGVRSHSFIGGYGPTVAKSTDGRLWFVGSDKVSMIDPHHLAFNKLPPPVHIEQVTADDKTYDASNGLRLPARVRELRFDFTALSFVVPEKVRIRVMLEGQDTGWREPVNERRVQYTNLPPRTYRFRVIACNESGVCNEEGDFVDFSIAPAFYQRTSFRVLCMLVFLGALFGAYRLRVRQLAHQFNKTLEVRVSERTRIARDLHDTLLQSVQGLLLRFQSVANVLPDNPKEAKRRLDLALNQAAEAVTEGRDAVQGLRSSAFETNDLASGIIALGQELTGDGPAAAAPTIDVEVEGATRNLNPIVRDEAYRIASEALRNAVRHAHARRISVEIHYARLQFRLRVRDDGKGIDEATLRRGRTGHFGLHGMRERAEIVRGRLDVWSKRDTGTEIHLSVPGAVAYGAPVERSWFSKIFSGRIRKSESTEP